MSIDVCQTPRVEVRTMVTFDVTERVGAIVISPNFTVASTVKNLCLE